MKIEPVESCEHLLNAVFIADFRKPANLPISPQDACRPPALNQSSSGGQYPSSPVSKLLERARQVPHRYWLYYIPLLLAAIGFGLFLKDAALPWEEGVQAREEAGKVVKSIHHGISGLWYGAWAALGVIAILAAAGPFALRKLSNEFHPIEAGLGKKGIRPFLIFGAIAIGITAYELAPSLKHSLWGDEDYSVRRAIVGQWERNDEGELWFRDLSWWDTLFAYKTPNNHFLYSILARMSHGDYHPGDGPRELHFDEARIRMPSFIAGLGAVLSLGYLVSVMGYRRAGIAAMFLLALHPWFLRHGAEARGYPLALFLAPLAMLFLVKAVRRGKARYWALFAFFEALTFYAYPGTLYLLIGLSVWALVYICFGRRNMQRGDRFTLASRWFTANTAAALPLVFLLMPIFKQLRGYMDRSEVPGMINMEWIIQNLAHMATGTPWSHNEPNNPLRPALDSTPVLSTIVMVLFFGLAAVGLIRILSGQQRWLAGVLFIPYPLTLLHAEIGETLIFPWYTITSLPLFIAAAAIGMETLTAWVRQPRAQAFAGCGVIACLLLGYALFSREQVVIQRAHSVEQLRESVEATRKILNPYHPDINKEITVQFSHSVRGYDPAAYFLRNDAKQPDGPERLKELLVRADKEDKDVYINISMPGFARIHSSRLMKVVDNEELFEQLPPLYGLQDPCTRFIYRYRRNSYQPPSPTSS